MAHQVTLLKLGGSVLTDKTIPNSLRKDVLQSLISQIRKAMPQIEGAVVLAHGSGSFAHVPASHYRTKEGFVNEQSRLGMAITQDSAATLNRLVVQECLRQDLPAVSVYVSNSVLLENGQVASSYDQVFREYLKQGLLPVTTGDVLVDSVKGCGIWSADTILPYFARQFQANDWTVTRLIHVTNTPGVYKNLLQPEQGIFEVITAEVLQQVESAMGENRGFDVTGGMWSKIQESHQLAVDTGIKSQIISGMDDHTLYDCLVGNSFTGTKIQK